MKPGRGAFTPGRCSTCRCSNTRNSSACAAAYRDLLLLRGVLIPLPLRFVGVQGLGEIDAGLLMLALSAPMLICRSLPPISPD
jgi:hypothetical protein